MCGGSGLCVLSHRAWRLNAPLQVGITGEVDFVDLDGVSIIVDLKGRFWHDRKMVLARVEKAIQKRIPECFEVRVRDPRQLEGGNDDQESVEQFYRH